MLCAAASICPSVFCNISNELRCFINKSSYILRDLICDNAKSFRSPRSASVALCVFLGKSMSTFSWWIRWWIISSLLRYPFIDTFDCSFQILDCCIQFYYTFVHSSENLKALLNWRIHIFDRLVGKNMGVSKVRLSKSSYSQKRENEHTLTSLSDKIMCLSLSKNFMSTLRSVSDKETFSNMTPFAQKSRRKESYEYNESTGEDVARSRSISRTVSAAFSTFDNTTYLPLALFHKVLSDSVCSASTRLSCSSAHHNGLPRV